MGNVISYFSLCMYNIEGKLWIPMKTEKGKYFPVTLTYLAKFFKLLKYYGAFLL